jgi:hypothetical protein
MVFVFKHPSFYKNLKSNKTETPKKNGNTQNTKNTQHSQHSETAKTNSLNILKNKNK